MEKMEHADQETPFSLTLLIIRLKGAVGVAQLENHGMKPWTIPGTHEPGLGVAVPL